MYNTPFTAIDDHAWLERLVRDAAVAQIVTTDADGVPQASLLPVVWDGGSRLVAHAARANPQFAELDAEVPVLAIVQGPDAYVNPEWYPSTRASHRSVPTWNYVSVHLSGTLRVRRDAAWLHEAVRDLSVRHADRHDPHWDFDAMPEKFYAGQLHGIVGLDITVTRAEGKAKLNANRTEADRMGVVEGLEAEVDAGVGGEPERAIAALMRERQHWMP